MTQSTSKSGSFSSAKTRPVKSKTRGPSRKVTDQLISATLDLLKEKGAAGIKMEAIADRAGIHKTTLYRRYGDTKTLIKAVIAEIDTGGTAIPDTGSLQSDLLAMTRSFAEHFQKPAIIAINRLIAGGRNSDLQLGEMMDEYWRDRYELYYPLLDRAKGRDEAVDINNYHMALEIIVGPMVLRTLMTGFAIDRALIQQLALNAYQVLTGSLPNG